MNEGVAETVANDPSAVERLACLSNQLLHLILLPTEACNFRCTYCYEEFRYKRMNPEVVRGVKNLMRRRSPGLSSLSLSWFGGEPLLATDIMVDVLSHARHLTGTNLGLALTSDVTTNGYLLTPKVFRELLALGVTQYQISFDGPPVYHDRVRVMHGGKGTFDRIWENLLQIRQVEGAFDIMIRLHASRFNIEALPEFIDSYETAFGRDARFELYIRTLSRLGGPHDATLPVFELEEGRRAVERLRSYADSRGLRQASPRSQDSICYAARTNSFVVRANGRLNKCTVALEHPNNQVGQIHEDGTVETDRGKILMWMRGFRTGSSNELKCPMIGYADPTPVPVATVRT